MAQLTENETIQAVQRGRVVYRLWDYPGEPRAVQFVVRGEPHRNFYFIHQRFDGAEPVCRNLDLLDLPDTLGFGGWRWYEGKPPGR